MYPLTIKVECCYATEHEWRNRRTPDPLHVIQKGETVEYLGHVPGGMVQVRHKGETVVIHPGATVELS